MHVDGSVIGNGNVGVKEGTGVKGIALESKKWVICRWQLVVEWKRYLVMGGVHWIKNEEGFVC